MKCLIIDDDPLVCDMLSHFVSKVDFLEYSIQCQSGTDALNLLAVESFDLVFLDIDMPEVTGMELIKNINPSIPVIIITSSSEFALESYNYHVIDYLLKPVNYARFYKAVQKAYQIKKSKADSKPGIEEIFIKDGHNLVKLNLKEVLYIEAVSNYVSFKTATKTYLSLMSMQKLEESLPDNFMRIHRSYMVNIQKIDKIEAGTLFIGDKPLPISNSYKDKLLQKLNLLI
ncbi:response regulator transcription factor [Rhodocytophaga rosea]|uniref:Response regulator transcription factor n=1 Tax=Rhodocytophaga rosea TaxID=2704465 RepID=A0A6C0GMU0_9BACT|nr:LytTR family DNA-binding domain-containing protein [Rhodocytophaga rosea]QHT69358.1 response regulator transcription factor [Rhodocytophaga rosea]